MAGLFVACLPPAVTRVAPSRIETRGAVVRYQVRLGERARAITARESDGARLARSYLVPDDVIPVAAGENDRAAPPVLG